MIEAAEGEAAVDEREAVERCAVANKMKVFEREVVQDGAVNKRAADDREAAAT